jgi:hypothetical protein
MNAILFFVTPTFRLTGSTINAIEYFLAGFEHNKELKLILVNGTNSFKRKIQKIMYERYTFNQGEWEKAVENIDIVSKYNIPSMSFDTILILDYVTIFELKGILRAKKILVISEKHTDNPEYFLSKDLYNVEYYGEMPFHYKDIEYRMKCLFSRYKPLGDVSIGTYVNAPYYDNHLKIRLLFSLLLPHPIFFKSKEKHKENLFENFTCYLYYHADKWFDPHPRLFLECTFYNKEIVYYNPKKIKDGSWYRYHDVMDKGLWDRRLNKNDVIIGQLI